jgi:hypothetical protein
MMETVARIAVGALISICFADRVFAQATRATPNAGKSSPAMPTPSIAAPARSGVGGVRQVGAHASNRSLGAAMAAFRVDTGRLPTTTEGLSILIERPPGVKNWNGPYVTLGPGRIGDTPFLDPWGTQYRYTNTSRTGANESFEIRSAGPDQIFDTPDDIVING